MRELVPDVFDLLVTGSGGAEELFESLAAHPDHNERYAMEAYQHYSRDDDTVRRIGLPSGALVMLGTALPGGGTDQGVARDAGMRGHCPDLSALAC
jgi:hypothetical protein